MRKEKRKTICGVLLMGILLLNAFLTFQSAKGTVSLSEGIRHWLEQFGFKTDFHSFRSNAHLVMFFMIGILLSFFGQEMGWSWRVILLIGFLTGFIDEGIKLYLPTREFDAVDLTKDWIGIVIAVAIVSALKKRGKPADEQTRAK